MWFAIILFILFIIYTIFFFNYHYKENKKIQEEKETLRKKGRQYNAIYQGKYYHVCGLPLAENSECILYLCNDKIVIESYGNIFKLQKDKILDINTKTSKEIQNSISNAVGGAMLLGPIGAFLTGTSTEFHRFFIIIYKNKENKEQCISFDMKDDMNKLKITNQYIKDFKSRISNKQEIDL
ncbi:MAG: hypothetical protein ACLVAK_07885 [Clostridia bacterium]